MPRQPVILEIGPLGLCGVDEAGRGPLAGPVTAAAVMLDPARPIDGLRDSKKLSAAARERLAGEIRERAAAWCVAEASVAEIDVFNILQATLLAMQRAVAGLGRAPDEVLVDGNRCPQWAWRSRAVVKGDDKVAAIAAASILAKTARDAFMVRLHAAYPEYGFAQHMGYGTAAHLDALKVHGACPQHRRSFAPVKLAIDQASLF
jgi:ribonuclease HII